MSVLMTQAAPPALDGRRAPSYLAETVAASTRDHSGATLAALGLSAPRSRFSNQRLRALAREVRDTAIAISSELGYPGDRSGDAGRVAAKRTWGNTTRRVRAG